MATEHDIYAGRNKGDANVSRNVILSYEGPNQARNRELAALTTRESVTWTTAVHEVTITAFGEAGGTAGFPGSVAVCFDAPSDIVADTWLTQADSTATDSQLYVIMIGQTRTFYFSGNGITRLDAKKLYGGEATVGITVEAA